MTWCWLERVPDEGVVADLLTSVSAADLARAGLPEPMVMVLAPQQSRARLLGHAAAYPQAEQLLLGLAEPSAAEILVGRLLVDRSTDPWVLVDVVVRPSHQRGGAGTWMLNRLTREADAAGQSLSLRVHRDAPAAAWYQRLGFLQRGGDDLDLWLHRPPGEPRAAW